MIWLVIVLAVVALALAVALLVTTRRLRTERSSTVAAEEQAARHARELADVGAARQTADRERTAAVSRADAAEARLTEREAEVIELNARTADAELRVAAMETERDEARREADAAVAERLDAEEQVRTFEQRALDAVASAPVTGELDAQVVWALERSRSERTWRHSVAVGPDGSAFSDAAHPLADALQIELDAAREEVGAVVELDAELPAGVTAAGSVLVLKAAQELLADVIRQSETTTLRVRADGLDLLVEVDSRDEEGNRVEAGPLPTPQSSAIDPTADGVRIRNAVAPAAPG